MNNYFIPLHSVDNEMKTYIISAARFTEAKNIAIQLANHVGGLYGDVYVVGDIKLIGEHRNDTN